MRTFAVYECPHCRAALNNAPRRITARMKKVLSARTIKHLREKVIRYPPHTVLSCNTCRQDSVLNKRGKWRLMAPVNDNIRWSSR